MFVLRLTSSDTVVGLESDDGFTIGQISTDTFFLIIFAGAIGVAGSVLYGLIRVWIPERWRAPAFATLGGLVGGAAIVHADGIDFFLLEPRALAVAMFVALPALGAATISVVTEAMLRRRAERSPGWLALLAPLPGLALGGPLAIVILVAVAIGFALERWVPLVRLWQSEPVAWLGRAVLAAWGVAGAVALINDIRAIAALPA